MKKIFVGLIFLFFYSTSFAQTITQPTGTTTSSSTVTCGTTYDFYDTGGSGGVYSNDEDSELTVCPSDPTMKIFVSFTVVSLETCCDDLAVYDGTGTGSPLDVDVEGGMSFISSAADGCLTFTFDSDFSATSTGWEATLSCAEDICVGIDSPTDLCTNAPLVDLAQAFAGTTNCSYTTSVSDPTCGGISLDNSSWLAFIAAATDVVLDWEITGGSSCSSGIQLGVFEGNCSSLSFVGGASNCLNPSGTIGSSGQFTMSSLTVGNQYYLMIDGFAGDLCDYNIVPVSGVAITPDNDDCESGTILSCGGAADTGDIVIATDTDAPNACPSGGAEQEGIWYTFTGDGNDYTVNTAGSNFETDLNIYYSTDINPANYCSTLVCEISYTGAAQEATVTFTTTNGRVYYVYLDGKSGATGNYSISLTCASAPPCDAEAGSWN
jgi:hypothetical protein